MSDIVGLFSGKTSVPGLGSTRFPALIQDKSLYQDCQDQRQKGVENSQILDDFDTGTGNYVSQTLKLKKGYKPQKFVSLKH